MRRIRTILYIQLTSLGLVVAGCGGVAYKSADKVANDDAGPSADAGPLADAGRCIPGSSGWAEGHVGENRAGVGTNAWGGVSSALVLDAESASASGLSNTAVSTYLVVRDFRLGVPSTAKITGIEADIARNSLSEPVTPGESRGLVDYSVRLTRAAGIVGADRKAVGVWNNQPQVVTYGTTNDLWSAAWSPADVNDVTFGVGLAVTYTFPAGNDWAFVNRMRVRVTWTCPTP